MKNPSTEQFALVVVKGGLQPADGHTQERLRARGYRVGDQLLATLRKNRNPIFHRRAHRLGVVVAENIDDFAGMNGHQVLKRLQIESGVGCDIIAAYFTLFDQRVKLNQRVPRSLSYDSMEEGEFREIIDGFTRYLAETYWHNCSPEQIEAMAAAIPE